MALSVGPYITASILVQLFGILIPKLAEMQNGMQDERDRIEKLTFIVGIIMAVLQSVNWTPCQGHSKFFRSIG